MMFLIRPLGFREALKRALANEDREFAETRSSTHSGPSFHRSGGAGQSGRRIVDSRSVLVPSSGPWPSVPLNGSGGKTGWYYGDWLWRVRGLLELLFGGAGMRRGRRDPTGC